jgi:small subunit ribosomal protein S20
MTKKLRNKKHIKQNKRNRIINRRYTSTIKTLFKLLNLKIQKILEDENLKKSSDLTSEGKTLKTESQILLNNLYSIIDKAVKKDVIHKNTAARKKSNAFKTFSEVKNFS